MNLKLEEVRRLTGPNLLWDNPGAILDVIIDHPDKLFVITTWQSWMDKILAEFGWTETHTFRVYSDGASMALSAPMDALYTACDLAELAWDCAAAELNDDSLPDWHIRLAELRDALEEELNPELNAILGAAVLQGVTAISDDDELSLGMGTNVDVWPVRELPKLEDIDWQKYQDIPRAFVTGTNGKSTSVRLASEIAKQAGFCAGVTSTDFIRVGDDIIDEGDYSGPGGARMLLRDKRTQIAFLEVARGGILRRGLPIEQVNAALITNVASDHLGQYGINNVEDLAMTKFVVAKGVKQDGVLVLNADNKLVVQQAKGLKNTICWFSEDANHPLIRENQRLGGRVVFIQNGMLVYGEKNQTQQVIAVADIPMTLGGAAKHNVQNVLGVVGLSFALNMPVQAIQQGLKGFGSNAKDNPGRGNLYDRNGVKIIVDFAHNEHSMKAVIQTAKQLKANRYLVMFSNGGDRSDEEIYALTRAVSELNADKYVVAEIEKYLRGREPEELLNLVKKQLMNLAVDADQIECVNSPIEGTQYALNNAKAGDLVLLFVLDQRDKVHQIINAT